MKKRNNFIVPVLAVVIIALIYLSYFAEDPSLGSWADFDPNNTANKDIRVEVVRDNRIQEDAQSGLMFFYARDASKVEVFVHAPLDASQLIKENDIVILRGHLHHDYFHAAGVEVK
ncbi:MAG: hypothetical protein C0442_09690 [Chlorobiaceae bacterium]|nr:hypothetical protein [Chlorobiaceae bacterium]